MQTDIIDQFEGFGKGIIEGAINFGEQAALGLMTPAGEETESSARESILSATDYLKGFVSPDVGEEDLAGRKIGQAFGSFVPPVAASFVPFAGPAIAGASVVGAQVGEASERAREEGATETERGTAALAGILPGVIDIIPIKRIKELREVLGEDGLKNFTTRVKRIAEVGGIEAATEMTTSVVQNLIQKNVYDPSKEILGDKELSQYAEEGSLGALVGGVVQGVLDLAVPSKRGKASRTETTEETAEEVADQPTEESQTVTPEDDVADTTPLFTEEQINEQREEAINLRSSTIDLLESEENLTLEQLADLNEVETEKMELVLNSLEEGGFVNSEPSADGTIYFIDEGSKELDVTEQSILDEIDKDIQRSREKAEKKAQETVQRNEEDSQVRAYDEINEKVKEDLTDQEESGREPFSWETKNFVLSDEEGNVKYSKTKRLLYQVADKFIGLKDVTEHINKLREKAGLKPLTTLESAYDREESIAGKAGNQMREFEQNNMRPLAKEIADAEVTTNEVDIFLMLRHAIERNNRLQLRNEKQNAEANPGAGSVTIDGKKQRLTNSFVKKQMKEKYNMDWNDESGTWSGGNIKAKRLLKIADKTDQIIKETRDRMADSGLISKDTADAIGEIYKYYTPLKGREQIDDLDDTDFGTTGKSYSIRGKEILGALGRSSQATSPIANILKDGQDSIKRGLNNKEFGQSLVDLIQNNPNDDYWEVYSPRGRKYEKQFSKKFKYLGTDPEYIIKNEQGETELFDSIPEGANKKEFIETIDFKPPRDFSKRDDRDLIGVKIDGKQYYVDIKQDSRLRKALLAGDVGGRLDDFARNFGVINRFLSMVNTSLNPEFVMGNFSRDVQTAMYNLLAEQEMSQGKAKDQKLVKKVLLNTIPSVGKFYKALRRVDLKDGTIKGNLLGISQKDLDNYKDFVESGAKADWFYVRPVEEQVQTMDNLVDMAKGTFTGNFKQGREAIFNFIEDLNSSVENGVRFSTFIASRDALIERGVDPELAKAQAATLAKNLTINFNRKGMSGELLNSLYLFFNASVQGTLNFARGMNPLSKDGSRIKQGAVAGLTGLGALISVLGEELSEEDPESGRSYYSEIPDYIKERNMVIMIPPDSKVESENMKDTYVDADGKEFKGKQKYMLIPLPYGYNVFHYLGQSMVDVTHGHKSVPQASSNLLGALFGSFSPIGSPSLKSVVPTVGQPFLEVAQNENFFGSPIYKDPFAFGQSGPYATTHMSTTRSGFVAATKFLNDLSQRIEEPGELPTPYERGFYDKMLGRYASPDVLEHFFEFSLGGFGKFGLNTASTISGALQGEEIDPNKRPFARKVYRETDSMEAQADFYDRDHTLKQKEKALKNLNPEDLDRFFKENEEYIQMIPLMKANQSELRKLREYRKLLQSASNSNPTAALNFPEEEERLDLIEEGIYKRFNKEYDKVVGRTK